LFKFPLFDGHSWVFIFVCGCRNAHLRIPGWSSGGITDIKRFRSNQGPHVDSRDADFGICQKRIFQLVGGIPTPLKKYESQLDDDIPNICKKCSKPPTRLVDMPWYAHLYMCPRKKPQNPLAITSQLGYCWGFAAEHFFLLNDINRKGET
jgi:hypothetical protein